MQIIWSTPEIVLSALILKTGGIDFPSGAIDFHHQAAADKMYHLLSDGGTLKLLERDKSRSLLTCFGGFLHRNCIKDHVVYYGKNELLSFYEKSGFINVRVIRTIRRYFWKKKLFTSIVLIECDKISEANYGQSDITGRKTGTDAS